VSAASRMTRRRFSQGVAAVGTAWWYPPPRAVPAAPAAAPCEGKVKVISTRDLKATALAVGAILRQHIETGYMPGAVALIAHADAAELVIIGDKARERQDPLARDSIFRIASMTKPITAAATMMLVEDGRLRLNEPVERWLPELANRRVLRQIGSPLDDTVPAKRPITVEDLLTFRCGLGIVLAAPDTLPIQRQIAALQLVGFGPPDPASPIGPDEWLRRLGTLPLMAQPGEQWLYNTGAYILGVLLARVSGSSLPALLQKRVFEPLGMQDTAFFVPQAKRARLVSSYRLEAGRPQLDDAPASSAWGSPPAFPDGGAGLVSTADDYRAFSRLLLAHGRTDRRRLLSPASVAAMTTDHLTPAQRAGGAVILGDGRGWGLGMSVVVETTAEGLPVGTYGWNGGLGTTWVADPHSGLTAILLTQTMFTSPVAPAVHQEFWHAVFSPAVL
jgi:CubicO group peptidase (beta-lactamase class C family)